MRLCDMLFDPSRTSKYKNPTINEASTDLAVLYRKREAEIGEKKMLTKRKPLKIKISLKVTTDLRLPTLGSAIRSLRHPFLWNYSLTGKGPSSTATNLFAA